ncbi:uncharacterized protein Z519_11094 [Cladophialophora bantiana CBS 173.52]|uniref:Phosphoglycerate mutase n=1 Tax=Cladophialophora bantiana (strain ATCC 10958 / CBS 173.52 / CDC B-1940 / NIH 8579) TaxID=1442370 RepID=A0A0D2HCB4_CLAB1|nr:uncharacterized protein Z519_11094 [Cladophialophora bantiana CBS 173.52]KIW88525.1 hypothetical protein Z519_11094 [Cladophialophora bantiana CBS 173.52]
MPQRGMPIQLSTTRRIPDDSPSINFAMKGNVDGLRFLFSQKLAHPKDVSQSRGYTLMRWALYGGMHNYYETVKFLISQGAPVDEISSNNVWGFAFRGSSTGVEQDALRCVTEGSLAAKLGENPNAIYLTDTQNRTVLDWATARAQLEDITLPLRYGADPNNTDETWRTPVLHAVDSHNIPCPRLILKGGGNPNPVMPKGIYQSSPLTAAGFAGTPEMLKLLLDFDANPKACNPEGLTALHSVARTQNVECARLLLEYGADLNAISGNGVTPLTTAIMHNNHAVMRLFVDHCYEYITTASLRGVKLLSAVAEFADVETINILSSTHPMKRRRDYSDDLFQAFEELIATATAEEAECRSTDSLVESGLFLSAKSSFHEELAEALAQLESVATAESVEAERKILGSTYWTIGRYTTDFNEIRAMTDSLKSIVNVGTRQLRPQRSDIYPIAKQSVDWRTVLAYYSTIWETEWTKNGRYTGRTDIALTAEGESQVDGTAKLLVGTGKLIDPDRIAHVWVSPRKRAQQTFHLLFSNSGSGVSHDKVTLTEDIAEWDYGDYEGLVVDEIVRRRKAKGLDQERKYNIWRDGCEGGESPQQVAERLDRLIAQIKDVQAPHMNGGKPADVVLVAHGLILRCFVKRWLKYPIDDPLPMMFSPGAIAMLSYKNHDIDSPAFFIGMALPSQP